VQQNELLSLICNYLSKENHVQDNDLDLAKVWASKLKTLNSHQRIFAEKAVNDILFEAQLGTLNRNSVQINSQTKFENYSYPLSSSTSFSRSSTPQTLNSLISEQFITTSEENKLLKTVYTRILHVLMKTTINNNNISIYAKIL
jgi:hypothetical protein